MRKELDDKCIQRYLTILSMCLPMLQLLDTLEGTPVYKQKLRMHCKGFTEEISKLINTDLADVIDKDTMGTAYSVMDCHLELAKTIATLRIEQLPEVKSLIEQYKKDYDEQVHQQLSGSNHQLHTS